jgi:hypothetical protein
MWTTLFTVTFVIAVSLKLGGAVLNWANGPH